MEVDFVERIVGVDQFGADNAVMSPALEYISEELLIVVLAFEHDPREQLNISVFVRLLVLWFGRWLAG